MTTSGIYQVRNTISGKSYIGSAVKLELRKIHHFGGYCSSRYLQNAMHKYGKDKFVFEVLELVSDPVRLVEREQFWLDKALAEGKVLYNIALVAGSSLGVKQPPRSEKWRKFISRVNTGRIAWNKGRKGLYQATEETRKLLSLSLQGKNKGRKHSEEVRRHNSEVHRGIKPTEESNKKRSESCALAWTLERRKTQSRLSKGIKRSEETKKRMKEAWKRRKEKLRLKGDLTCRPNHLVPHL